MNTKIKENLAKLDSAINDALIVCASAMNEDCRGMDEGVDAMGGIIDVVARQHQASIWALVGSLLQIEKAGDIGVDHSSLRETINNCVIQFSEDLRDNIAASCKNAGHSNILDPNDELRREILNDNL